MTMLRKAGGGEAAESGMLPPPWGLILDIVIFVFFTPPMLYFWLGLCALGALWAFYLKFKEYIDPVIIVILDVVYFIVSNIVFVCQAIWNCIKRTAYPIKESILSCTDKVDHYLNPYKVKR